MSIAGEPAGGARRVEEIQPVEPVLVEVRKARPGKLELLDARLRAANLRGFKGLVEQGDRLLAALDHQPDDVELAELRSRAD